jgi:PAS domain S-box-containing protein
MSHTRHRDSDRSRKRPAKQRVDADHPLLKREAWLRLAAQSAEIGLWYWNEAEWDLFWDAKSRATFGVNMQGPVELDAFYDAVHPDDVMRVKRVWRGRLSRGAPYDLEYRARRPDGSIRWVHAKGRGYYDKLGRPLRMVGVHVDVTERKQIESDRSELSGRLIQAQELERTRLAREIHDDFCQRLAVLSIEVGSLASTTMDPVARKRLSEIKEQVSGIGEELHTLSHRFHASKLELLGLARSIQHFCAEFAEQQKIRTEFSHTGVPPSVDPDTALALYRIVQEGLYNVAKHSYGSSARVDVTGNSETISLLITDNGVGLDPSKVLQSGGIGLQSMKERALMVGGTWEVKSRPMAGTRIAVAVPVKNPRRVTLSSHF